MDAEEFRKRAKEMVDYVADYLENIRERRPLSDVKPGYLRQLVPDQAPRDPEPWDDVFADIERVIMPGVSVTLCQFTPPVRYGLRRVGVDRCENRINILNMAPVDCRRIS